MIVREYRAEDFEAVKAIHEEMGLDYQMPKLDEPLFFVRKVAEQDGKIVAASALMIQAECYLWCSGGPKVKMDAMKAIQPELLKDAWLKGVDTVVCWVPAEIESKFAKRLAALGWSKDRAGWQTYSRPTEVSGAEE